MQVVMASHLHSSKAELRKSNKPIMEKRRRARINNCLDELKSLILEAMKKDPSRHAKLEKADILEMTVKHLQDMQRTQMRTAVAADPSVLTKFHSGFNECATEVTRYVSAIDGVEEGVKRRLLGHLTGCMTGLSQVLPLASQQSNQQPSSGDVNNNTGGSGRLQILAGLSPPQVLPTSTSPQIIGTSPPPPITALPATSSPRLLPSTAASPQHRSAFSAVHQRCSPPLSPLLSDSSSDSFCHQELRVHIADPGQDFHLTRREDRLLMEAPRPSPQPTVTDMWRPW